MPKKMDDELKARANAFKSDLRASSSSIFIYVHSRNDDILPRFKN